MESSSLSIVTSLLVCKYRPARLAVVAEEEAAMGRPKAGPVDDEGRLLIPRPEAEAPVANPPMLVRGEPSVGVTTPPAVNRARFHVLGPAAAEPPGPTARLYSRCRTSAFCCSAGLPAAARELEMSFRLLMSLSSSDLSVPILVVGPSHLAVQ